MSTNNGTQEQNKQGNKTVVPVRTELTTPPVIVHGKVLKRASEYLQRTPFYPTAPRVGLEPLLGVELVLLAAQVVTWTGGQFGDGDFTLFYGYPLAETEEHAFTFKCSGEVVSKDTRRLLNERRFPMVGKFVQVQGVEHPYYLLE